MNNKNKKNSPRLARILSHFGWAVVQLDTALILSQDVLPPSSPQVPHALSPRLWKKNKNHASHWKSMLVDLFAKTGSTGPQHDNDNNNKDSGRTKIPGGIYRQAESGSATSLQVEPKESWEVSRRFLSLSTTLIVDPNNNFNNNFNNNTNHWDHESLVLYDWIQLLHQIATTVRQTLELPPNVLLWEEPNDHHPPDTQTDQGEHSCSMDLLRAFFYHIVPPPKDDKVVLGSSPHSDWGSWTVVWQDDVGGLETYCHACRTWNPIAPACTIHAQDKLFFVVHVSDLTSLALGLAAAAPTLRTTTDPQHPDDAQHKHDDAALQVPWPSPRHRVVSPQQQSQPQQEPQEPRVSLVYFAYPPPHHSLAQVVTQLQQAAHDTPQATYLQHHNNNDNNNKDSTTDMTTTTCTHPSCRDVPRTTRRCLVLDDYSLLHNQAASSPSSTTSTPPLTSSVTQQLQDMMHTPLQQVLDDKWNQVQRS